jgi:magnesium-transporting ATPase (P-type)
VAPSTEQVLGARAVHAGGCGRASAILGEYVEAGAIGVLLVFNAALGFFQEGRAQATLDALKSKLALNASVRRDGVWRTLPAAELVPGDLGPDTPS